MDFSVLRDEIICLMGGLLPSHGMKTSVLRDERILYDAGSLFSTLLCTFRAFVDDDQ